MNLKPLFFGAVFGFLVAVVPSCGGTPCGPANCNGCCDSTNKCVPQSASNSNTACGKGGATCSNCMANNQVCNTTGFVCEFGGTGGGTGGGSTGGGTGGGTTGGGTGGGTTGGGTGGGTTGGGTGGGTTGGGTGGGSTGGGSGTTCTVQTQNCATGSSCLYNDNQGNAECFPGTCDIVAQNCPNATDKCTYAGLPDGGAGRVCAPAGTVTEGQACGPSGDNCAKGLACVGGTCAKFCYSQANCTASGSQCVGLISIPGTREIPSTCVTLAACDPLLQNCNTSGQGCYLTQNGPACITAGTVPVNGTCGQTQGNCTPGNLCLLPSAGATSGSCKAFCNLDGGMPNCGGAPCGPLSGVPYGACQ